MAEYFTPEDSQKALANAATLDDVIEGEVGQQVTSPNGREFKTLATFDAMYQEVIDTAEEKVLNHGFVARVYSTPSDGVAAGTGVPNGKYFNARSSDPAIYAVEYLNNNGTAQATGKTYPTLQAWTDALEAVTTTGDNKLAAINTLASQKTTDLTQLGDAKIADVAATGEQKKTQLSEIAATVSGLNAGQEFFQTETALKATTPSVTGKVAKALDTKKVWYWSGSAWVDTGLSELDLAIADATTKTNTAKSEAITAAATDATTKANTAKSEAISAAATDATSKANTAKSEAITAAATDATTKSNAAEVNAKTYAENLPKLANKIVATRDSAIFALGVISGNYTTGGVQTPSINLTNNSQFGYLFPVKPNTTYTICINDVIGNTVIREFNMMPETIQGQVLANGGSSLSATAVSSTQRYYQFTTGSTTSDVFFDPRVYTKYPFTVFEGAYNPSMWDGLSSYDVGKILNTNLLKVINIDSPMFMRGKNLFEGFSYQYSVAETREIGVEVAGILANRGLSPDIHQYVSCFIPIEPNTTYTISKDLSEYFQVVLLKDNRTTGRLIFRDSSARDLTFTSGAEDYFVYIYLSRNYEKPRVQIELGSVVTSYESTGIKFSSGAEKIAPKLTESEKPAENVYINLGKQTDRFYYPDRKATTETVLSNLFDPLVADFPNRIEKNLLGKDSTGTYDIFEYVFEPDKYEQTIFITAGMHTTEIVTPFALGTLLNEAYRNPDKHEGLAYIRNKVKVVVIPVVNVWAMNVRDKVVPTHYLNPNGVNIARNFPERWDVLDIQSIYDTKGATPLSEAEAQHIATVMRREKDNLSFYLDCHTAQNYSQDTIMYWQENDNFLRPVMQNIVSMRNDIIRQEFDREPVNETFETQRATSTYYPWRVFGIPSGTVEYSAATLDNLSSKQLTDYTDLLFNVVWYALKEKLLDKRKQVELNEHNKQYISLYNTITGYNDVINQKWTYAQWQANCYDKLGLTKSVIGAASGTYELVKYVHEPSGYKNTVVLCAGLRGKDTRKSVTELGFFAHKLMTDSNPHIVALRSNTRFIFLPVLNPYGHDNNNVNNANAVQPYLNFATSTQPESVVLRSFIDTEAIDLFIDIDSLLNANKPAGYADCQIIHNAKADAEYQSVFAILKEKYAVAINSNVANYSTSLIKSQIADYINGKGIAYSNHFFAQNVLPLRTTGETSVTYVDYGYEANELAYCTEVLLNNIKEICQRRTLSKYLAN